MKKITFVIALLLCFYSCNGQQKNAQQSSPSNWQEYHIPDICSFSIPPTMELRNNESMFGKVHNAIKHSPYWEWVCDECDIFNGEYNLVFQPDGINDMDVSKDNPFATYARILINFRRVTEDDLTEDILSGLTAKDKNDFDEYMKELTRYKLECTTKLTPDYFTGSFEWNPIEFTQIDGVRCVIFDFNRPGHNAQTHVRSYEFYLDDYYIEFILSYNVNDTKLYKNDFDNFIQYLHFDNTFKQHKYQSAISKIQTYTSVVHNLKYEYDGTEYASSKINNAPHMLLKLNSNKDDTRGITLAAFDDLDLTGYTAHDNDVVEYFQMYDEQMEGTLNGATTTLISSCQKVTIGKNIKALRTIAKSTYAQYNQTMYMIVYRFTNDAELQTLNIFLSKEDYQNFSTIEPKLTSGLSYIK